MNKSRQYGLFTDVPDELWNDWKWQVKNRIETLEDLKKYIKLTPEEEEGVAKCLGTLRMAITPYYLSLINPDDPYDPIRRQCIPSAAELYQAPEDQLDPLHEDTDSPVPGLTHRYPDRVLFLITDQCSMYCRHCTRRRFAGQHDTSVPTKQIDACLEYIRNHTEVRDVLLSGGDVLTLSDAQVMRFVNAFAALPQVEIVRICTRAPVSNPARVTDRLARLLAQSGKVWANVHINTVEEVEACRSAAAKLVNRGIPVSSQTVMLRGVNDSPTKMLALLQALSAARIRPYYVFQCDPVEGLDRFRVPLEKAKRIEKYCAERIGGLALPRFVADLPGAKRKTPLDLL